MTRTTRTRRTWIPMNMRTILMMTIRLRRQLESPSCNCYLDMGVPSSLVSAESLLALVEIPVQFWSGTRLNLDKSFKLGPVKTTYIYKVVTSDLRHAAFDDDDDDDVDSDDEFEGDFDASDSDTGSLPDLVGLGSFNSSVMSLPDLVSVDNPDRDMGFYWNLLKRPSAPEP